MKRLYDKTAEDAIGHVAKEQRKMAELAIRLRTLSCNPSWAEEQLQKFTGIYRRLLTDPIDEVYKTAKMNNRGI